MRRCLVLWFVIVTVVPLRAHADEPSTSAATASAVAAARAAGTEAVRAPERSPLRDISLSEGVVSGILSASVLGASLLPYPTHQTPQWQGGILFDDPIRDALGLSSPGDRQLASTLSDGLVSGLVLTPVLLDAMVMAWAVRGDPELMARMLLMNMQAHAVAQGLTTLFKHVVGRERPVARGCREDPERQRTDPACQGRPDPDMEPASFFSGHSSLAFTSAALICLQHTELGLFGPEGDAAMCATGMALATGVGLLRIAADKHYATDVLVGAAVGLLSGWLVPWLMNFDIADAAGIDGAAATVSPMVSDQQIGVQVFGVF